MTSMPTSTEIRPETHEDIRHIRTVNTEAFETDAEAKLVDQLRETDAFIAELSLVAVVEGQLIGHLLLTKAALVTPDNEVPVLALAPMAVTPDWQRRGIGSMLIRHSLDSAAALGHELVIVLGHPDYYPKFGFLPASRYDIKPPCDWPDEAFLAQWIGASKPRSLPGIVRYPEPFSIEA